MTSKTSQRKHEGRTFSTLDGREIALVEGLRCSHSVSPSRVLEGRRAPVPDGDMTFGGFMKDVLEFSMMVEFLQSLGLPTSWDRFLDIGGAEGTVAALMKAAGMAAHAECIDIKDWRKKLSDELFQKHTQTYLDLISAASTDQDAVKALEGREPIQIGDEHFIADTASFGYCPPLGSQYWQPELHNPPELDDYIVGTIDPSGHKFDLISALLAISHMDPARVFPMVANRLKPGGVFYFITDYWWWPVNSSGISGDIPYLAQRFSRQDIEKFVHEFSYDDPADVLDVFDAYHDGGGKYTLDQYIDVASASGLRVLGSRRLCPFRWGRPPRSALWPEEIDCLVDHSLDRVLSDISKFRGGVVRADLMTAYVMAAFAYEGDGAGQVAREF